MKADTIIWCDFCHKFLGKIEVDTADCVVEVGRKIQAKILAHRQQCKAYRVEVTSEI